MDLCEPIDFPRVLRLIAASSLTELQDFVHGSELLRVYDIQKLEPINSNPLRCTGCIMTTYLYCMNRKRKEQLPPRKDFITRNILFMF